MVFVPRCDDKLGTECFDDDAVPLVGSPSGRWSGDERDVNSECYRMTNSFPE